MLSYRHAYHAGNHADLLKHLVFTLVLDYYNRKDKPYICVDTHAGAGYYHLDSDHAQKTAEYRQGITLLRAAAHDDLSPPLVRFLTVLSQATEDNPQHYPGSPTIATSLMRQQDYLRLCELHPTDAQQLEQTMQQKASKIRYTISQQDGLNAALAWLPPPNRRAVVLTDPSYEIKEDYSAIPTAFHTMHKRCREACLILWYPRLSQQPIDSMLDRLRQISPENHLIAELHISAKTSLGMYGSGMFVINPPYILREQLEQALPKLTQILAQDRHAQHYHIQTKSNCC